MSMTFISGLSAAINNLTSVTGTVNNMKSITGNITKPDQVIYQVLDYEMLEKLPTIDDVEIKGEFSDYVMTPNDAMTNLEILEILNQ